MDKNLNSKVSVIIPCYNAEKFLKEAVLSIINQTYRNLEIICIDDGSTDSTIDILYDLNKIDKRVIVIKNERNLKLVQTLNIGVTLSTGKYIARMDADDIAFPNRIESQIDFIEKNNIDICGTYAYLLYPNNRIKRLSIRSTRLNTIKLTSLFDSPLIHPSVLAKADVFRKNPYNDNEKNYLIEDYELWRRLIVSNYNIAVLPEYLLYYRINPNGESQARKTKQISNHMLFIQNEINKNDNRLLRKSIQLISGFVIEKIFIRDIKLALLELNELYKNYLKTERLSFDDYNELKRWFKYKYFYVIYQGFKNL